MPSAKTATPIIFFKKVHTITDPESGTQVKVKYLAYPFAVSGRRKYGVTQDGRVWSQSTETGEGFWMKPTITNKNAKQVFMGHDDEGVLIKLLVHRLVAVAWIDNPLGLIEIDHDDDNRLNNHMDNLKWCTHSYNMKKMHKSYDHMHPEWGRRASAAYWRNKGQKSTQL